MNFTNVLHALHCQPWLITEEFHAVISDVVAKRIEFGPQAGMMDLFKTEAPKMTIEDGVANIPIEGVIGRKLSAFEKSCGACAVEDIEKNLSAALADKKVSHIMLSIDSPGGSVSGVPEIGAMIAAAARKKPMMTYADGLMASAAYWLGCGANVIYGSESSVVGSIGVYVPVMDQSRRYEQAGVKVEVIKAGKFKGAGYPGTAMSDEQKAQMQGQVNQIKAMFDAHVLTHRGGMDMEKCAQGQVFIGQEAKSCKLMDEVASKSQALADLRRM